MVLRIRIDKTVKSGSRAIKRNCNLNCIWCHSDYFEHTGFTAITNLEIIRMVQRVILVSGAKIVHVRIAGAGDPTLVGEHELSDLTRRLKGLPQVKKVKLTTNGVKLAGMAEELRKSGMDGISISLNSTDRTRFRQYSQRDELDAVLKGIYVIHETGMQVKINSVYSKINEDELNSYERLSIQ